MNPRSRPLALLAMTVFACGGRTELDLLDQGSPPGGADASSAEDATGDRSNASDASLAFDGPRHDDASVVDARIPPDAGGPPSNCNSTTCPQGCCSADGTCVESDALNACGSGGEACEVCPPGDFCKGGCFHWQTDCSAANCAGCCSLGLCSMGSSNYACGRGGGGCQRCVPSEGTGQCEPQTGGGGLCNGVVSCDPTNCPGCCVGNVCMDGVTNSQCGHGGMACQACGSLECRPGTSSVSYGGDCVDAGACGPGSCPGCCAGVGCAYGDQDTACGTGGASCDDCTIVGQTCVAHGCQ